MALAAAATLGACTAPPPGPATVRLGLEAGVCADYCAETLRVSLKREGDPLGFGTPRTVPCGEELIIGELPAGHRLYATVEVLGIAGTPLLVGESDVVTVAADTEVTVPVSLVPVVPPEVTAVSPDPVAPGADGVPLTVSGTGFADPGGAFGVELDGVPLMLTEPLTWTDDTVLAMLSSGETGAGLVVRRCGVASEPFAVRVVARDAPAMAAVALPPSCAGRQVVALAAEGEGALAAIACDDAGLGYLQRLAPSGACPLGAAEYWPLGANPVAVTAVDGHAWVAVEGGEVLRLGLEGQGRGGPPNAKPLASGVATTALVAVPGPRVFAIGDDGVETDLYEIDPETGVGTAVDGVDGLALADLAADGERVYAAGTTGAVGKLVKVRLDGGVSEDSLTDCANPVRVATGPGRWVALACDEADGPRVVGVDPDASAVKTLAWSGGVPSAVALDAVGDVALSLADGGVELVAYSDDGAAELASWGEVGVGPALRLGSSHRFLTAAADGADLQVVAPYQEVPLCDAR